MQLKHRCFYFKVGCCPVWLVSLSS